MKRKIHKSHRMTRFKFYFGDNSNMFLKPQPSHIRYCKKCKYGEEKIDVSLGRGGIYKEQVNTHKKLEKQCKFD